MEETKVLLQQIQDQKWYQSIKLTDNYTTPGETGNAEADKLKMMQLPDDMTGISVLDVGCNEGFYSFELERRGAAPILAFDKDQSATDKFAMVSQFVGSKVEFQQVNLLDLDPAKVGQFDLVLCLAVFHHLKYPFQAVDRLYELTKKTMMLEVVEAIPEKYPEQSCLVRKLSKKGNLHILPTRVFLTEILLRAGFSEVKLLGTHRGHELKPHRKAPGFSQHRALYQVTR